MTLHLSNLLLIMQSHIKFSAFNTEAVLHHSSIQKSQLFLYLPPSKRNLVTTRICVISVTYHHKFSDIAPILIPPHPHQSLWCSEILSIIFPYQGDCTILLTGPLSIKCTDPFFRYLYKGLLKSSLISCYKNCMHIYMSPYLMPTLIFPK